MSHAYEIAATRILDHLHRAETELLLRAVVLFNGEAGEIASIKLDEVHGLCFTFEPPPDPLDKIATARRFFPVSTIKHLGPRT